MSEFNLQQWASKEKYFAINTKEHFAGLVQGRIQGFNKALDLLMQLAKEEYGDEVISFEHIVNKLRGDNERV